MQNKQKYIFAIIYEAEIQQANWLSREHKNK